MPGLAPPRPIPIKERASILFLEKGRLDVLDGALVLVDEVGVRVHIPIGGVVCLMLEPVSHAAVVLAARAGTLLIWVGEAGVRLYAAGQPGGARSDRLLYQARLVLDDEARLKVVRKMYALRFGEEPPGVYVGNYGRRVREMIWGQVLAHIEDGNAVIAWAAPNDAGFSFDTCGANRRVPVDVDGFRLVQFGPEAALPREPGPMATEGPRRRGG